MIQKIFIFLIIFFTVKFILEKILLIIINKKIKWLFLNLQRKLILFKYKKNQAPSVLVLYNQEINFNSCSSLTLSPNKIKDYKIIFSALNKYINKILFMISFII